MNEREAMAQGLRFTGMWHRKYDTEKAQRYKNEISELKKKYKVRCVKVSDDGGYGYYGDDNFLLVQYDDMDVLQDRLIKYIPDRIEKARIAYEKELAEIEKFRLETLDKMEKVKEIMK